jgi:type I restriction enzyme M protein
MAESAIISKVWNLANVLRNDGVGYGDYLEQTPIGLPH